MGGLKRSNDPERKTAEGKIGAALHSVNDNIKYNEIDVKDNLTEVTRGSTYVETNVAEFTSKQQEVIKAAIMTADTGKKTSRTGVQFGGVEDVKFVKGKNGNTMIELQSDPVSEIKLDYKKLEAALKEHKDDFKDVRINVGGKEAQAAAKQAAEPIGGMRPEKTTIKDHSQAPTTQRGEVPVAGQSATR